MLALKKLDQRGLLDDLKVLTGKKVLCYILRTNNEVQATYGSLRGNDLQAEFVRKAYLHELLYVVEGLRETCTVEKAVETVMRYGKLLKFGHDDISTVKKLGSWPNEALFNLTNILKKFETFQTEDARDLAKRQVSLIMEGQEIVKVPHSLLRNIGKMTPELFNEVSVKINSRQMSLKQAAEEASKLPSRVLVTALIRQEIPGYLAFEAIVVAYPGKFSVELLDTFSGAVIGKKAVNQKGQALKDYCKAVVSGEGSLKFQLKEIKKFDTLDLINLPECDTIVINCTKLSVDQVQQLRRLATQSSRSLVILLSDQDVKINLFCDLSTELDDLKEIFFTTNNPLKKGDFLQNLKLGIIFAPTIFKPPLKSFNGSILNLVDVLGQITPPGGKNVFVNEGNLQVINISDTFTCEYFCEKAALERFNKSLKKAGVVEVAPGVMHPEEQSPAEQVSDEKESELNDSGISLRDSQEAGHSSARN